MDVGVPTGDSSLAIRLRVKKFKILTRYYLRAIIKQLFVRWVAWILFAVSFILFILILFPNLLMHRLPIFGQWDVVFKLEGRIFTETTNVIGKVITNPVGGATLEVGGYRTRTNPDGTYDLTFPSKSRVDIPIVLSRGKITVVNRITFPSGQLKMKKDFLSSEQP